MKNKAQYGFLNKVAKSNGIVLWGSSSLYEQPINELLQSYGISKNIYNRSVAGLSIAEAENYLDVCVYQLRPSRIIINLGEEDLKYSDEVASMIEQYRWILYKIHVELPNCQIVVTTVPGQGEPHRRFNEELMALAKEFGCTFYRIPSVDGEEEYCSVFLNTVKLSLYDSSLDYSGIANRVVFDLMMQ